MVMMQERFVPAEWAPACGDEFPELDELLIRCPVSVGNEKEGTAVCWRRLGLTSTY